MRLAAPPGCLALALLGALGAVALSAAVRYGLAEPVPERGITLPALVPAFVAALSAYLVLPAMAPPVAFAAGGSARSSAPTCYTCATSKRWGPA